MKKLNNKGYITVEILIASIITVIIAVFLIELTVKLVSKTDDAYVDTVLTTDKVLITNQIMNDINNHGLNRLSEIKNENKVNGWTFTFSNGIKKNLYIHIENEKNVLIYCEIDDEYECIDNKSYINHFDVRFDKISYDYSEGDYISIKLTLKTIYSDKNYGFSIVVPKEEKYIVTTITYTEPSGTIDDITKTYKLYKYGENTEKYSSDVISIKEDSKLFDYILSGNYNCNSNTIISMGSQDEFIISASENDKCEIELIPSE